MFRHILFPVDFSPRSYGAVPHVRAMVERSGAALTIVNVLETPPTWTAASDGAYVADFDLPRLREDATARLTEFAAAEFPDLRPTLLVEQGDPGSCIAELAKVWNVDLIMIPTHGGGIFRSALLGSATAKILHDSHCAVWTGVHMEEQKPPSHTGLRNVMCALDLVPEGVEILRFAAGLAKECNAVLRIVHAVPGTSARPDMYFDLPLEAYLKEAARKEIADMQAKAGTAVDICMEVGSVAQVVHEASVHHNADLVVIGRGVLGDFAGRLRTHAYSIIREAPCPVLSI